MNNIIKNYKPDESVFIIDGHSMIYRAYYALIRRPLINSKGFNTSAIFGFMKILFKLMKTFKPKYLIISFDTGKPNFRHKLFKEYKANRKKMPDDLIPQIPEIKKMIKYFGIPQVELEGYEADDVIAQLSKDISEENKNVFVVTKDKDLLQIINEKIKILQPVSKQVNKNFIVYDNKMVKDTYKINSINIIDYLSLTGDTADNIPGVKGIGPKTATKLIIEYKTIENLYSNIEKIKEEKTKQKLVDNKDNAFLSKDLIILKQNISLNINFEDSKLKEPDKEEVINLFKELEINALLKELNWFEGHTRSTDYKLIDTESKIKELAEDLIKAKEFSLDTETDNHLPIRANLVGLSFSIKENSGYYIPIGHSNFFNSKQISIDIINKHIKPIIESEKSLIVGQNIKYDYIVLKNYDITLNNISFDTMVGSYLINPTKTRHNLNELAQYFLGYNMISFKEVIGKNKDFSEVQIDKAKEYSCEDADITYKLFKILKEKINELKLKSLLFKLDIPLIKILADMEINGIKINILKLKELDDIITKKLNQLTEEIHKQAGEVFNINSTKQLSNILFEKLQLPAEKKGKTGLSTDIEVLRNLQHFHPIAKYIIEYRTMNKLKTTYIDTLPKMINPSTQRIHTSFSQTITATGRLSSSDPNLQNIPIKDDLGKQIREAFIPEKGNLFLSADYSQIELRILAHITNDELLIDAFKKDQDIHTRTIMELYKISEDEVTPELRRNAKTINYGIIYGMSAFRLSKELNIDIKDANNFINTYFEKYKGIKKYIDDIKNNIDKQGYVENLFGRRRYLPDMSGFSKQQQAFVIRTAINTPIQGTSADLIKFAMIDIFDEFNKQNLKSKMLLQVHDELLFEVIKKEKDIVYNIVKNKMENVQKFKIPIKVDIGFGENWGEAH